MNYMIGDTVLYGSDGVCRIEDITERKIGGDLLTYYILKPIYDEKSTVYVPLDNPKLLEKMKRILSEDEIYNAIEAAMGKALEWIDDDNERKAHFKKTIDGGVIEEVIGLVRLLCLRKRELEAVGRKLRAADEIILKECERMVFDEFALVLRLKRNQAAEFLFGKLGL